MTAGKPTIGITMGDAAGIGPEIVVRSLADESLSEHRCLVIGDAGELRRVASQLDIDIGGAEIFDLANLPEPFEIGIDSGVTGKASAEYIETAVRLWREGTIDAISTAPISKTAIKLGGFDFPGHTEFLARLTDTDQFAMSFFAEKLRVILLTTHLPLKDAIGKIQKDRLVELIDFASAQFGKLLGRQPVLAVAGLNPHASEGGMFGSEEADEIIPAIENCRGRGIDVRGPHSPDTIFLRGYRGEFDAIVALYHDQATIAVKSLSFGSAVNVTLGLPVIRTSVDHGTAYDIAGKGVADASSMTAAIRLAGELANISRR